VLSVRTGKHLEPRCLPLLPGFSIFHHHIHSSSPSSSMLLLPCAHDNASFLQLGSTHTAAAHCWPKISEILSRQWGTHARGWQKCEARPDDRGAILEPYTPTALCILGMLLGTSRGLNLGQRCPNTSLGTPKTPRIS